MNVFNHKYKCKFNNNKKDNTLRQSSTSVTFTRSQVMRKIILTFRITVTSREGFLKYMAKIRKIYLHISHRTHFVRVPGTADLFQSQFSSLSMNLQQDIIIAYSKGSDGVIINTSSSVIYPQMKLNQSQENLTDKQK